MIDTINKYMDAVDTAYPKVKHFIYGDLSTEDYNHIINIAASIMMTRDNLQIGGGFSKAIVNNDLAGAFERADIVCERAIKFFVYVRQYVHVKPIKSN